MDFINFVEKTKSDEENKGLYVSVKYSDESIETLIELQKFFKLKNPLASDKLHTTVVYSRKKVDLKLPTVNDWQTEKTYRLEKFGNALVMIIKCPELDKLHKLALDKGATYDYDEYHSHITLSYDEKDFTLEDKEYSLSESLTIVSIHSEDLDLEWVDKL